MLPYFSALTRYHEQDFVWSQFVFFSCKQWDKSRSNTVLENTKFEEWLLSSFSIKSNKWASSNRVYGLVSTYLGLFSRKWTYGMYPLNCVWPTIISVKLQVLSQFTASFMKAAKDLIWKVWHCFLGRWAVYD